MQTLLNPAGAYPAGFCYPTRGHETVIRKLTPVRALRPGSLRTNVTTDAWGFRLYDPQTRTIVRRAGPPVGRVISALPPGSPPGGQGPRQLRGARVLIDPWAFLIADPQGNVIGTPGVWASKGIYAVRTPAPRRF